MIIPIPWSLTAPPMAQKGEKHWQQQAQHTGLVLCQSGIMDAKKSRKQIGPK